MTVCWASGTTLVVCWRIVHSGVTVGFVTGGGADIYYCAFFVCVWLTQLCAIFLFFIFQPFTFVLWCRGTNFGTNCKELN